MKLAEDNRTCVSNERVLLFSRPNEIRGVDLDNPYYHIIPPISLPQVLQAVQLDFFAEKRRIYWVDAQVNEVKRVGLVGAPIETVIDTAIENPHGIAVDWMSQNIFYSSQGIFYNHIAVCTLQGEYVTRIIHEDVYQVKSLAVAPARGKLFWSDVGGPQQHVIYMANMDGTDRVPLVTHREYPDLDMAKSLSYDVIDDRLYWVNAESHTIQFYDFISKTVASVSSPSLKLPTALAVYKNHLYYSDQEDTSIHIIDKTTGDRDTVLRTGIDNVLALKIYDPEPQSGTTLCSVNRGNCSHLCLPISPTQRVCKCAAGFQVDPEDHTRCVSADSFLLYSLNWEIKGVALGEKANQTNRTEVLGPISRVLMATSIDFLARDYYIYWVDSDHGSINRIHRDGTNREVVADGLDSIEGLAIDWIAGNMYWTNPKFDVIEVARINGSYQVRVLDVIS